MGFWDASYGTAFLDGSGAVGVTAADQPQNPNASTDTPTQELICDRTGFRQSLKQGLKREWTGAMVRAQSWEPRHPQDYVRVVPDKQRGSPRPEAEDYFLTTNEVSASSF